MWALCMIKNVKKYHPSAPTMSYLEQFCYFPFCKCSTAHVYGFMLKKLTNYGIRLRLPESHYCYAVLSVWRNAEKLKILNSRTLTTRVKLKTVNIWTHVGFETLTMSLKSELELF